MHCTPVACNLGSVLDRPPPSPQPTLTDVDLMLSQRLRGEMLCFPGAMCYGLVRVFCVERWRKPGVMRCYKVTSSMFDQCWANVLYVGQPCTLSLFLIRSHSIKSTLLGRSPSSPQNVASTSVMQLEDPFHAVIFYLLTTFNIQRMTRKFAKEHCLLSRFELFKVAWSCYLINGVHEPFTVQRFIRPSHQT